jgi:hypothetical protein
MVWQVWVPLVATILIALALGVLAIVGAFQGSPQVDHWGAISAVVVIAPVLVIGVVILAITAGVAFGVIWLHRKMPGWMLKLQLLMLRIALVTRRAADAATKPVMATNTFSARVSALWNTLFHRQAAH